MGFLGQETSQCPEVAAFRFALVLVETLTASLPVLIRLLLLLLDQGSASQTFALILRVQESSCSELSSGRTLRQLSTTGKYPVSQALTQVSDTPAACGDQPRSGQGRGRTTTAVVARN